MPAISVIVPVYNVERYLPLCIDSIRNQTFKDIEIICVDDHSTDGTYEELIARWRALGIRVETGRFRTEMQVSLVNDGPVTILLDSEKNF